MSRRGNHLTGHGDGAHWVDDDTPAWLGWLLVALFTLFALAMAVGGITLLTWLVVQAASAIVDTAAPVLSAVGGWGLTRVITAPVQDYFAAHVTGLPLSLDQLWRAWAAAGLGLLALSWTGSFGARIGWTLIGAATAAMVHVATPEPGAWVATGITALTWAMLSIPAFAGVRRPAPVIVEHSARPSSDCLDRTASTAPYVPSSCFLPNSERT